MSATINAESSVTVTLYRTVFIFCFVYSVDLHASCLENGGKFLTFVTGHT